MMRTREINIHFFNLTKTTASVTALSEYRLTNILFIAKLMTGIIRFHTLNLAQEKYP